MKQAIKILTLLVFSFNTLASVKAQKIEYNFGESSDVIDSVKNVISWFKKMYHQDDIKKLNLYADIDYCDGHLNLNISQYNNKKGDGLTQLAKTTNRIIRINPDFYLPLLFNTDVLSNQMIKERVAFIHMGGYYLQIEKIVSTYGKL